MKKLSLLFLIIAFISCKKDELSECDQIINKIENLIGSSEVEVYSGSHSHGLSQVSISRPFLIVEGYSYYNLCNIVHYSISSNGVVKLYFN